MGVMLLSSPYPVYSMINSFIFQTFAFLACASHLRTMFTDPVSSSHTLITQLPSRILSIVIVGCFRVLYQKVMLPKK